MGVEIEIVGNCVLIYGLLSFLGVNVMVIDLWVFVCLVFVGLVVEGEMMVDWIYYFDCGYQKMELKLYFLGVWVECIC